MPDLSVSRRTVAIALAGGVVGAKLALNASADDASPALHGVTDHEASAQQSAAKLPLERRLVAPLTEGARLLSWEVVAIEPLAMGAVKVQLRGESGVAFGVEVLARDRSPFAAAPPARSDRFALHVLNGGNGRMPTAEEQGLAAMALAQIVADNEALVPVDGFLTHAERIAEHSVALLRHVDGSTEPPTLGAWIGQADPADTLEPSTFTDRA